ncbi:CRISPR-associated helicase Cas3' [Serratia sp. Se-RSBMAAmG]|uniref:CRISPR-associated helicase Cas3' n=1 Tax=Serratia sp. Se-RSBMAAmG TaxID=3043305 RepID=UPI0024AFB517|nr:CRISPR-associated helicase Cas3' [Serratia sp. Se-RSBMAAmG]MDI6977116.1 CRISPR-associated helicase Cas3' [Serratia sp. Se-RSBMAAmG]
MFANTKKQTLIEHSLSVAMLSENLFKRFVSEDSYNEFLEKIDFPNKKRFSYKKILNSIFLAGLFHDIGKVDDNFQNYINEKISLNDIDQEFDFQIENLKKTKIDINKYPLHNEFSFAISSSLLSSKYFSNISNEVDEKIVNNIIYFHHAKLQRDKKCDFSSSEKILRSDLFDNQSFLKKSKEFIVKLYEKLEQCGIQKFSLNNNFIEVELDDLLDKDIMVPVFQPNNINNELDFFKNAITHLCRSILVSADRLISKESHESISELIKNKNYDSFVIESETDIGKDVANMLTLFKSKYGESERNIEQSRVAKELSEFNSVSVLKGPAGVGKTKIMLEWLKNINNKKKTFIIVPKTSIALSLYEEIRSEYLTESSIEIVIGDLKENSINNKRYTTIDSELFSGDVIITTIDQILNMMMSHTKIDVFLDVLNSNIIFDEFHEFLYIPAISMLFIEIVYLKHFLNNRNCLLVSATPNYFLLKKLLISEKNVKKIKSFNNTKYKINLIEFNDNKSNELISNGMFEPKPIGEICIFNTATKAQYSAMKCISEGEENTLVFHSKFNVNTKRDIFSKIMTEFGKDKQTRNCVLRVGPILQASVDLSTHHMHTEISNIDNIYQRLGRVVRWNESDDGKGEYSIYLPKDFKAAGSIKSGLEYMSSFNAAEKFSAFIKSKIKQEERYTLNELYDFYDEFFKSNKKEISDAYQDDFNDITKKSNEIFSQKFEPTKVIMRKNKKDKTTNTMSSKSLRGKSMFCFVLDYVINSDLTYNIVSPENIDNNIISMNRNDFFGNDNLNRYLEESRDQLSNNMGKDKILEEISNSMKNSSYQAKKNLARIPAYWLESFARNESMPLVLSFDGKTKKIDFDEQFFNVNYKGVRLGLLRKSAF